MSDKITRVAEGIISEEQAKGYGWLEEPYKSNKFLEGYNVSQEDGKLFSCFINEKLPKFLVGANLTDANLTVADLTDADLTDANLRGANLIVADLTDANLTDADLTGADLTGANLTNAKIDANSLIKQTKNWSGVDFTNTQLFQDGDLLDIGPSRKIIIDRMVKLKITDAKGLGDDYQTALKDAKLIGNNPTKAEIAPTKAELEPSSLAKKGFVIVAGMPNEMQMENISRDPNVGYPLDADEYNPTPN